MQNQEVKGMPEGAFDILPAGKEFSPYIAAASVIPEVTLRSVILGLIMAVIFSAAAAFSGLKIGQVFEAAIPIAIFAVGISPLFKRKSTILENVIIQSIGAASGVVVAGAIFTLPAIIILGLDKKMGFDLLKIFAASFLGGSLGILFLIPFRKYFVKEMHGQFPFPEATATAQILVTGEQGGNQAKILMRSMLIGSVYDFMVHTIHAFNEVFTSGMKVFKLGSRIHDKAKVILKFDTLSMVMGLGYIIGLRYSAIIVAGSMLSWLVLVPAVFHLRQFIPFSIVKFSPDAISAMSAQMIFNDIVRQIGIGAIAMAGLISIVKSRKIIFQAFGMGFKQMKKKGDPELQVKAPRTDRDMMMKNVLLLIGLSAVGIFLFLKFFILNQVQGSLQVSFLALLMLMFITFLFTSVAARAIAITGSNPVSGMTLMTLILSSIVLRALGLMGDSGMMAALMIGGVVCTALSMSGGFITDLKIGYWMGSTPVKQQTFKFLGTFVSALSVGGVILILNKAFGFDPHSAQAMAAPQANAMATIIQGLMKPEARMPLLLLLIGAVIALIVSFLKLPVLAFALGMYLQQQLNTPLLIGGLISFLVMRSTADKELSTKRNDRGILIASGFIAGGALVGVLSAILKVMETDIWWTFIIVPVIAGVILVFALRPLFKRIAKPVYYAGGILLVALANLVLVLKQVRLEKVIVLNWADRLRGEPISMLMFIGLCLYLYLDARAAKKEN
jgi:putative OPT family oligopeptide transporter